MLNGLVTPTSGRVLVDGLDVARHGAAVRRRVAFAFTDPAAQLVMPTCVEDVELSLRAPREGRRAAARRGADVLEQVRPRRARARQRALAVRRPEAAARAGRRPRRRADVLVADEPTTLLDLANTRRIGRPALRSRAAARPRHPRPGAGSSLRARARRRGRTDPLRRPRPRRRRGLSGVGPRHEQSARRRSAQPGSDAPAPAPAGTKLSALRRSASPSCWSATCGRRSPSWPGRYCLLSRPDCPSARSPARCGPFS